MGVRQRSTRRTTYPVTIRMEQAAPLHVSFHQGLFPTSLLVYYRVRPILYGFDKFRSPAFHRHTGRIPFLYCCSRLLLAALFECSSNNSNSHLEYIKMGLIPRNSSNCFGHRPLQIPRPDRRRTRRGRNGRPLCRSGNPDEFQSRPRDGADQSFSFAEHEAATTLSVQFEEECVCHGPRWKCIGDSFVTWECSETCIDGPKALKFLIIVVCIEEKRMARPGKKLAAIPKCLIISTDNCMYSLHGPPIMQRLLPKLPSSPSPPLLPAPPFAHSIWPDPNPLGPPW